MSRVQHQRLADLDRRHLWHPFTQMQGWMEEDPLIVDRAEGVYLIDTLGRGYLDGISSLWSNVLGHRKAEIDDEIRAQVDRVGLTTLLGGALDIFEAIESPHAAQVRATIARLQQEGGT